MLLAYIQERETRYFYGGIGKIMCKMKKVLLVLMIMVSASAMSAQEVSLSLKDCIVLSENNNPYIKNTYLDVQSARFQKKEVFVPKDNSSLPSFNTGMENGRYWLYVKQRPFYNIILL